MSIELRTVPLADNAFRRAVQQGLATVEPHMAETSTGRLRASGEGALRGALREIRVRYPDAWVRRQDPMGDTPGAGETWYVFRDETPYEYSDARRRVRVTSPR